MIDYLAALLEGTTARELAALGQREAAAPREKKGADPRGESQTMGPQAGTEGLTVPASLARADDLQESGQEEANVDNLMARDGSVYPEEGENHLYTALRRSVRQVRAAEGGTHVVPAPDEAAESQTADWSQLDRAVERDARRYDGGFDLY